MAKRTGVLDCNQAVGSSPLEFIKKSAADMLVRRLMADRISPSVIRRRSFCEATAIKAAHFRAVQTYIPTKLPPINVPNTIFQLPQSVQWALEHRNFEAMVAGLARPSLEL